MSKFGYLRVLLVSLLAAAVFGLGSLLALSWFSHSIASKHRDEFMLFVASSVERAVEGVSLEQLKTNESAEKIRDAVSSFRPGVANDGFHKDDHHQGREPNHRPRHDHHRHHEESRGLGPQRPDIWLFDGAGDLLFTDSHDPDQIRFTDVPKPAAVHEIAASDGWFHLGVETNVIKIEHEPPLYLVMRDEHRPSLGPLFAMQAVIMLGTLLMAVFVSLSITFYYLRRKSDEARGVLGRLEQGDLKARFEIQRFDEFAGLLLDFNRMAEAIERLVDRVHTTEGARKNLLQELGHDLRTPLTSLTTSFETVKTHFVKMSESERNEVFEMMGAEVEYIRELLENLMTIASLHEPNYKASTETVDLAELIRCEVEQRRLSGKTRLTWTFSGPAEACPVRGDAHLIQRVFKNAFDNAERFAKSTVQVTLEKTDGHWRTEILDDGPGLSSGALESFGKRQEKRSQRDARRLNFSLGLGSVIMKTIAGLHSGSVEVRNQGGALVTVKLPAVSTSSSAH